MILIFEFRPSGVAVVFWVGKTKLVRVGVGVWGRGWHVGPGGGGGGVGADVVDVLHGDPITPCFWLRRGAGM